MSKTLNLENIQSRVKKIIAQQLNLNETDIKDESNFVDDFGADSLDIVELVMALEDEFEIEIPDSVGEDLLTMQAVVEYLSKQ